MKSKQIVLLILFTCFSAVAQQKLTIEEIYSGAFRPKAMDELIAMKNTNQYSVLNSDRATKSNQIDLYDFATLQKVSTIIDSKNYPELATGIDSYIFSRDEKQLLLATNTNQIYRHSFTADYFLFNLETKKLTKILEQVQEPTFDPTGNKIAFAKNNNLYIYTISSEQINQITTDGKKNSIYSSFSLERF